MSATSSEPVAGARSCLGLTLTLGVLILLPAEAAAQTVTLNVGQDAGLTGRIVQLFALVTLLSVAPGIAMMVTCFPFMVTVLAILRQGLGLQQSPPNMLIVTLAIFLTWFVMQPVLEETWRVSIAPLSNGDITQEQAWDRGIAPFRTFMEARVAPGVLGDLAAAIPGRMPSEPGAAPPLSLLVPAFMLSEIERAFEIGFVIFLPFLIIDLVVASILMSMGMMMVPPVVVSLPFKLAFFVVADGWSLIAAALVQGYGG